MRNSLQQAEGGDESSDGPQPAMLTVDDGGLARAVVVVGPGAVKVFDNLNAKFMARWADAALWLSAHCLRGGQA
ncbi:MAG: hypothetical protein C0483_13805 [Pirellula sp.]|nr:hypothetical protein [Pirellula sp.]